MRKGRKRGRREEESIKEDGTGWDGSGESVSVDRAPHREEDVERRWEKYSI